MSNIILVETNHSTPPNGASHEPQATLIAKHARILASVHAADLAQQWASRDELIGLLDRIDAALEARYGLYLGR